MVFLQSLRKGQKRFVRALLVLFAAFLIFGGPTYLLFVLDEMELPRLVILPFGLVSFIVGIFLFLFLSKDEAKIESSG